MINTQMIVATIIHSILLLWTLVDPEMFVVSYFVATIVGFNILGIALISAGRKIIGSKVFLISSVLMVPIGMIGVLGARKIIDAEKMKKFQESFEKE